MTKKHWMADHPWDFPSQKKASVTPRKISVQEVDSVRKIRRESVIGVIMASVITDVVTDLSNVFSIIKWVSSTCCFLFVGFVNLSHTYVSRIDFRKRNYVESFSRYKLKKIYLNRFYSFIPVVNMVCVSKV